MVRWINGITKVVVCVILPVGLMHIKEPLLVIRKSSLCGGSRFPLLLSEWSFTIICLILSASLNKTFPYFINTESITGLSDTVLQLLLFFTIIYIIIIIVIIIVIIVNKPQSLTVIPAPIIT